MYKDCKVYKIVNVGGPGNFHDDYYSVYIRGNETCSEYNKSICIKKDDYDDIAKPILDDLYGLDEYDKNYLIAFTCSKKIGSRFIEALNLGRKTFYMCEEFIKKSTDESNCI